jgi:hypothetical protein
LVGKRHDIDQVRQAINRLLKLHPQIEIVSRTTKYEGLQ